MLYINMRLIIILIILIILNIIINVKYINGKYKPSSHELYENKGVPRYSSINGKCSRTNKYMGADVLGVSIQGYSSKDECLANNDICQKYNKDDCLKQSSCGYCSNKRGGMCLSSTPDGPVDTQYKMCHPSSDIKTDNKFTMGEPIGHILIKTDEKDVFNHTLTRPTNSLDYNLTSMV